jgi:hypothetical protein
VLVLRRGHALRTGEFAGEFLRSMDEGGKALRAHPDLSLHELQCEKRNMLFRLLTIKAVFYFF